jgi:hypothetical protein
MFQAIEHTDVATRRIEVAAVFPGDIEVVGLSSNLD